jgi:hypothetical protein
MGDIHDYIREMPKAELHIHHEGAVLPETLLKLADRLSLSSNFPLKLPSPCLLLSGRYHKIVVWIDESRIQSEQV